MPTVTIDHGGGNTETISNTTGWRFERELGKMSKLVIRVERDDAQAVTLNRKEDLVDLAGVYEGRLVDVNTGGPTYELIVYSREWDGKTVEPTAGGVAVTQTDDSHVNDYIGDVSSWSAGTVNQVAGSITLIANHAQPHERLRKLEQKTSGEVLFDADGNMDYVDSLGSDKSGSITLSPGNANMDGDLTVTNRGRRIDATHVKVIGAHEGEAQFFANLVPSSDGRSYDNKITYSTSRWSSSADDDWARWSNKDAASQDAVDAIANSLADELTDEHIEATARVVGEDIVLGDTVKVTKSEAGIDRDMRIHRIVTRTVEDKPAATVDEVLLSTRSQARLDENKRVRDVERFNTVFQGSAVVESSTGGIQAVSSSINYTLPFFYPNVEFEHEAELYVKAIPYRTFSGGAASGGGDTTADNADLTNVVTEFSSPFGGGVSIPESVVAIDSSSWSDLESLSISSETSNCFAFVAFENTTSSSIKVAVRAENTSESTIYSGPPARINADSTVMYPVYIPENLNGDTLKIQARTDSSSVSIRYHYQFVGGGRHTHGQPTHTHDPDPDVTEFGAETSSSVDVIVNSSTEATNIGSGEFETTVDLSDTLTQGQFNDIEVSSDSLCAMICAMSVRAYEQNGTQ